MLEVLASKQVDIYISLATSLIGAVIGLILDRVVKQPRKLEPTSTDMPVISISMQQLVQVSNTLRGKAGNDFIVGGIFLFVTGVTYLFFRQEVLALALLLVLFSFGAWAGSVISSLNRGSFGGWGWVAYLIVMLFFALAAVRVVGLAKMPTFAPSNFIHAQEIVNQWGITALRHYFNALEFKWFGFHLLGIILFFAASWRACLSMLNYSLLGHRLIKRQSYGRFELRLAKSYGRPWRNSLFLLGFMVTANYLVSGQFFMWFEYEMPRQVDSFIQTILHGRR